MALVDMKVEEHQTAPDFTAFCATNRPRLRQALVARYGVEIGCEVTDAAFAYGFEHWAELATTENPMGYLFRVAQSSARRHFRWSRSVVLPPPDPTKVPEFEPGLAPALHMLSDERRVIVLLVHAHDWSYAHVAEVLDIPVTKVRNELHRAMLELRKQLGGFSDDNNS
jgi:DNA-directed RNA polymerase specialized sigma24 family protein